MNIYHIINRTVLNAEDSSEVEACTYLGPITHRVPNLTVRHMGETLAWRKVKHPGVSARIGSIYLPQDFDNLLKLLEKEPLKKSGVPEESEHNLDFIKAEAENWIFDDVDSQAIYPSMWKDVPNVSEYATTASTRIPILVDKLDSLLSYKMDSNSRSFELRFPTDYCPIVWSFNISSSGDALSASIVFRSLEVSRNLLNDLYLFCVYFGYVFAQTDRKLFDINIDSINIFAQDAHIVQFD